jgi:hypothetical protein
MNSMWGAGGEIGPLCPSFVSAARRFDARAHTLLIRNKTFQKDIMPKSYLRLKPLFWTQAIRSDLDLRYGPGRNLSATCKPDKFLLKNGTNLADHLLELSFMEGEPTAADGSPLQSGIGQLFYNIHSDDVFVHGWYFSPSDIYSDIWAQVLNGGYEHCSVNLTAGPIKYDGEDPVWDTDLPLFVNDATVNFTRRAPTPDDQHPPKRQGLFGKR